MLVSCSQLAGARCANSSSLATLRTPAGGYLLLSHGRQQTRGFRFGRLWATYWADGGSHRDDIYRRPRCFRYKYTKSLDSTIEAGKESPSETRRSLAGHHLHSYWGIHSRGPHTNLGSESLASQLPDNPEGIRPGRNIEDVERQPMEDILFGNGRKIDTWQSSYTKIRNQRWAASVKAKRADPDAAEFESRYTIDPITNRKTLKPEHNTSYTTPENGLDIPSNTFSTYKPQFSSLEAPPTEDPGHVTRFVKGTAGTETSGTRPRMGSQRPDSSIFDAASLPRQPILESEQYVAEVNEAPVSDLMGTLKVQHNEVSWHRGDGIIPPVASPGPVWMRGPYPDLDKYRPIEDPESPFAGVESAEQRYEDLKDYDAVRYREPDGKIEGADAVPKYDDLDEYGAFRAHEPDGKYKQPVQSSVDPQELREYQAYRSHEPDGKYAAAYTDPEIEAEELERYSKPYLSHEPDGKYAPSQEQEIRADESELRQYQAFRSHEPDGKYAHDASAPPRGADELDSYTAVRSHEPDGKYAEQASSESTPDDLGEYTAFRSHEPDGKYAAQAESSTEAADAANHEAFGYDEAETTQIATEETRYDTAELGKYNAVRHNEPDGKSATDAGLEVYDDAELEKYRAISLDEPNRQGTAGDKSQYRQMLEQCMAEAAVESDAVDADTKASLGESKRHGLTGNYARDFPEEFTRSWSTENSDSKSSLAPSDMSRFEAQGSQGEPVTAPTEGLQSALERQLSSEQVDESPSPNTPTPVTYKVLVYDPVMQCIDTAETSSTVPDSATPLTPAEVLLRISNPSKFLPHFGPLQAQGFEIVSGAGDVLVFRKVRDAAPDVEAQITAAEVKTESSLSSRPAVNPIDMTGGPRDYTIAAERFASPTGFVNYDLPRPHVDSKTNVRERKAEPKHFAKRIERPESAEKEDKVEKTGAVKDAIFVYVSGGLLCVFLSGLLFSGEKRDTKGSTSKGSKESKGSWWS